MKPRHDADLNRPPDQAGRGAAPKQADYRLAVILYTDIAGFSRMMEKDEAGTLRILHFHNDLISRTVESRHGTVIKKTGDVFLADFRNTVEALEAALEIQDRLHRYNLEQKDMPLLLRMGIHQGNIHFFENDALGEGVNIAARLQSLAHPGCICLSREVYDQVLNKVNFKALSLGRVSLKNITKEIYAYEIESANAALDPDRGKPESRPQGKTSAKKQASGQPSEGSENTLAEIRAAILADTKSSGRRLSVDEALLRYGEYGVEAQEVIALMADQGLLVRRGAAPSRGEQGFDGESLGRDIERAVRGIVAFVDHKIGEYEDSHHGEPARWSEKSAIKAKLKRHASETETGEWDKELKDSDYWKPGREELAPSFEEYRSGLADKARRLRGGFVGNLLSFAGVNALLWFINLRIQTNPTILWAAIVSAGWGTGLISNLAGILRANAKLREADKIPDLEGNALATYKKLNIVRDSMARHTASVLTVPPLLFTIYAVATPTIFPWWILPSGIMAISWISHLIAYGSARRRLQARLFRETGTEGGWHDLFRRGKNRKAAAETSGPYASLYAQAEAAKDAIAAQVRAAGKDSHFDKELLPSLEEYVGQVRLLTQTVNEIDSIIAAIPMKDLEKDKAELKSKLEGSASPSLKSEYTRSVEEIEKQEESFQDLQDQREVLHLRLKSSVNSLKQMQLDIARLRAQPDSTRTDALDQVRSRTGQLSRYLEDLRKGYEEAREAEDPWKDLERVAREREAKSKALPDGDDSPETPYR